MEEEEGVRIWIGIILSKKKKEEKSFICLTKESNWSTNLRKKHPH